MNRRALVNLAIALAFLLALGAAFLVGRVSAPIPRVEMIWTPVAGAVSIAPPAEGEGLAVFVEGDRVGTWTRKDGAVYDLLVRIHESPRHPENWMGAAPATKNP